MLPIDRRRLRTLRPWLEATSERQPLVFVIVMPSAVHVADLALRYLSRHASVCCVANGAAVWEVDAIRSRFSGAMVPLSRTYEHGTILDAIARTVDRPFWLIDHDCYVLDPGALDAASRKLDGRVGVALYRTTARDGRVIVPETFMLLLDPSRLRAIETTYGVSSEKSWWETLPLQARSRLTASGMREGEYPEESKFYFDTLRVVALLAEADGCGFDTSRGYSAVCQRHPDVMHVGGTSFPVWPPTGRYGGLGCYFWRRGLEAYAVARARAEYSARWPEVPDSGEIRASLAASGFLLPGDMPDLLDALDALIEDAPAIPT